MTEDKLKSCFTWFLAFVPIITIYASPIPGLTIAEVILVGFWAVLLLNRGELKFKLNTTESAMLWFVGFVYFSFVLSSLIKGNLNEAAVIRMIRFTFYYISGALLIRRLVDYEYLFSLIMKIGKFATAFLGLQYLSFYGAHYILRGVIPFLPLYYDEYSRGNYAQAYSSFFRPTSVFLEPAHYAQFMVIAICIALWYKKDVLLAGIFSLGLIFSTSGQGLVIGVAIWIMFFVSKIFQRNKAIKKKTVIVAILCAVILPIILNCLWNTNIVQMNIKRLTSTGEASAKYARMGVLQVIVDDMSGITAWIGNGFGNVIEGNWTTPGIGYVLYGSGIIGLLLLCNYLFQAWMKGSSLARVAVIVFFLTFLEAGTFMHIQIILYMAIMQNQKECKYGISEQYYKKP